MATASNPGCIQGARDRPRAHAGPPILPDALDGSLLVGVLDEMATAHGTGTTADGVGSMASAGVSLVVLITAPYRLQELLI